MNKSERDLPDATTEPLVSVITCFYNEERFLEEAIQSVLRQAYTNWELLLVDDGSNDASTALAKQYEAGHPGKIFYIEHAQHANKGLSASRNAGIKKAKGEFVAYLDADDVWLPEKIAHQVALFESHPQATVILEASQYWNSWRGDGKTDIVIPVGAEQDKLYEPPLLMRVLYPLAKGDAPCPSGIMVRRSVHDNILFEESFRGIYQMYEDQAFLSKVYRQEKVFVSSACHNLYRQREASLVSSVHESGKYHTVRRFYLEWFKQQWKQSNVNNKAIDRLLWKALFRYHHPVVFSMLYKLPVKFRNKAKRVFNRFFSPQETVVENTYN